MLYKFTEKLLNYKEPFSDPTTEEMKNNLEELRQHLSKRANMFNACSKDKCRLIVFSKNEDKVVAANFCDVNEKDVKRVYNVNELIQKIESIIRKRERWESKKNKENIEEEVQMITEKSELQELGCTEEENHSTGENITESIVEKNIKPNENLPEIKPEDQSVTLCIKDGFRLEMMPIYNADNMIVEKCKLFLVNANTNIPMLGAGAEMQIAKEKIMSSPDQTVFNIIKRFIINFSMDDISRAFERAKEFLETSKSMLAVNTSLNIIDAYREVVRRAIERSKCEDNAIDGQNKEGRRCKYDSEEKMVSIRDCYMKEILEDTGYTSATFCKKICMAEVCLGVKLLKHQKGRYACNETGNNRFYKLWVIDELMNEKEAQKNE